jgi:hypothetical protein
MKWMATSKGTNSNLQNNHMKIEFRVRIPPPQYDIDPIQERNLGSSRAIMKTERPEIPAVTSISPSDGIGRVQKCGVPPQLRVVKRLAKEKQHLDALLKLLRSFPKPCWPSTVV